MVDLSINLLFQKKPPGKLIGVSLVFCNPIRAFSLELQSITWKHQKIEASGDEINFVG